MTEIRNKETVFGTVKNDDGSPVMEVVNADGDVVQEIHNKETVFGTVKNDDDTPVKEVTNTE
jgi:hypothetical protein